MSKSAGDVIDALVNGFFDLPKDMADSVLTMLPFLSTPTRRTLPLRSLESPSARTDCLRIGEGLGLLGKSSLVCGGVGGGVRVTLRAD